jgi:diacylglycerol kinase family enzyme
VVIAYNPTAGNFSLIALSRLKQTFENSGHRVTTTDSQNFHNAAMPEQAELVCIVGGDGTARTVISQNHKTFHKATYCIYPAGTVNLIAREAGYSADCKAFVKHISQTKDTRQHYLGLLNDKAFLCCASVGPDSAIVARTSPFLKRHFGRAAYIIALLSHIWRWPRNGLTVTVDGEQHNAEAIFILKAHHYAGSCVLDDRANLKTPEFRVLIMPRARRLDFLRLVLSAAVNKCFNDPNWIRIKGQTITIASDQVLPIQADGDILATTPAQITIKPEPICFL